MRQQQTFSNTAERSLIWCVVQSCAGNLRQASLLLSVNVGCSDTKATFIYLIYPLDIFSHFLYWFLFTWPWFSGQSGFTPIKGAVFWSPSATASDHPWAKKWAPICVQRQSFGVFINLFIRRPVLDGSLRLWCMKRVWECGWVWQVLQQRTEGNAMKVLFFIQHEYLCETIRCIRR